MPQCRGQWYCGESSCNALRCDVDPRKLIVRATRKPQPKSEIWFWLAMLKSENASSHFVAFAYARLQSCFNHMFTVFMCWFTLASGPRRLSGGQKGCLSRLLGLMQGYQGRSSTSQKVNCGVICGDSSLGSIKMPMPFHKLVIHVKCSWLLSRQVFLKSMSQKVQMHTNAAYILSFPLVPWAHHLARLQWITPRSEHPKFNNQKRWTCWQLRLKPNLDSNWIHIFAFWFCPTTCGPSLWDPFP